MIGININDCGTQSLGERCNPYRDGKPIKTLIYKPLSNQPSSSTNYYQLNRERGDKNMTTFQYVSPTEEQKATMQQFRDKYEALANDIKNNMPASRGLSLAMTKLEESAFWLNKAITQNA